MVTTEDWPATVALPGVISEGTLKTEDLLLKFIPVYRDLDPAGYANGSVYCRKCLDAYPESHSFGDFANDDQNGEEIRRSVLNYLTDALENLAPEGYYFGTQEGDGACFGFFEDPDYVERLDYLRPSGLTHCQNHGRHMDGTNHTAESCPFDNKKESDSQSHMGTLDNYNVRCACGENFAAYRNPGEPTDWESPSWEAHVKAAHIEVVN